MKSKKSWIFCLLSLAVFIYILVCIISGNNVFFDSGIMNFVYEFRNSFLTKIFKLISYLGEAKIIIVLAVMMSCYLIFIKKDRYKGLLIFFDMVNVAVLNQGIKYLVCRERPTNQLIEETGYSFPSGHSMVAVGFYGLLIYLIVKSNMKKNIKILLTCILLLIILLIGLSRIYLGVHYPSDIIGGFTITLTYLIIFINLFNKYIKKNV